MERRREPHPLLTTWAQRRDLAGAGKRAIVPGCGLGADAEYLAGLGFAATAFDISPTAIRLARHRHPDSPVEYVTADLLHLPRPLAAGIRPGGRDHHRAGAAPDRAAPATTSMAWLTAPGGTLLVIAAVHDSTGHPQPGPLTRAEIDQFAVDGLTPAAIKITTMPDAFGEHRWRATF